MTDTAHTPGPWTIDHQRIGPPGEPVALLCDVNDPMSGTVIDWPRGNDSSAAMSIDDAENEANARLIASAPAMLNAIATAGRIVGQVQDNPEMSADERAYALSRACDALGGTYFKTTGKPLEWWQPEPAIAKATEEVRV
jgi:hypothetical protein